MRLLSNWFAIGTSLLLTPVAYSQPYRDGYAEHYKATEKKLQPSTLAADSLIKLLDDDSFYTREVAMHELIRRGTTNHSAVIACMHGGSAEARQRAEEVMKQVSRALFQAEKKNFAVSIKLISSSPRFWAGTNQWLGGIEDRSLDSSVELCSDRRLINVTSPLTVTGAVTNGGEKIAGTVWGQNTTSTNSVALYLNRPSRDFSSVTAQVVIKGQFEASETIVVPMKDGKVEVRPRVCWITIGKGIDDKKQENHIVIVTDYLGRLKESPTLELLKADDTTVNAKIVGNRCAFQRYWQFPANSETSKIVKVRVKFGKQILPFEVTEQVTVHHPERIRSGSHP